MAYVAIKTDTLFDIAGAIRSASGNKDVVYKPSEMSAAIKQLKSVPDTNFKATGDCDYAFAGSAFSNLVENSYIEGTGITSAEGMFYKYNGKEIYADLTFDTKEGINAAYMFANCENLEKFSATDFISFYPKDCRYMFANCRNLKGLPNLDTRSKAYSKFDETTDRYTGIYFYPHTASGGEEIHVTSGSCKGMFRNCHSLYTVDGYTMPGLYNEGGDGNFYANMFKNCYTLDNFGKISVNTTAEIDDNQFFGMVQCCFRLKKFLFETDTNGKPLVAKWKNQAIDLRGIGVVPSGYEQECIFGYNSLIKDRAIKITSPSEYAQYHDNGYSWTNMPALSRYTYENIVETLKSLPDTSAYTGGELLNTIYLNLPEFYTDGTAIVEVAEEVEKLQAIGAPKGWQVNIGGKYGQGY